MFMVIINFPPIKPGKEAEFLDWFASTNEEFANYEGFIGRRLLKPLKGGTYAAIVEHETQETFIAMHNSRAHDEAANRVSSLFDGNPNPQFYEMIIS